MISGAQPPTATERTRARTELLSERQHLGTLEVQGTGTAHVDGEACELPCTQLLDPGEHRVEHEGRVEVVVVEREQVARLDLTPVLRPELEGADAP